MKILFTKQGAGFTLLEAVISVVIFGILMMAVYSLWMACYRATERIAEYKGSGVDMVMRRLGDAVQASLFHSQPKSLYAWKGEHDSVGASDSEQLSFVTTLSPDAEEMSGESAPPERVLFKVKPDASGKGRLMVLSAPFTMVEDAWQRETVLLENVESFHVRYWNEGLKDWVNEWKDAEHAPDGVQMGVTLSGERNESDPEHWAHGWTAMVNPSIASENIGASTNGITGGVSIRAGPATK